MGATLRNYSSGVPHLGCHVPLCCIVNAYCLVSCLRKQPPWAASLGSHTSISFSRRYLRRGCTFEIDDPRLAGPTSRLTVYSSSSTCCLNEEIEDGRVHFLRFLDEHEVRCAGQIDHRAVWNLGIHLVGNRPAGVEIVLGRDDQGGCGDPLELLGRWRSEDTPGVGVLEVPEVVVAPDRFHAVEGSRRDLLRVPPGRGEELLERGVPPAADRSGTDRAEVLKERLSQRRVVAEEPRSDGDQRAAPVGERQTEIDRTSSPYPVLTPGTGSSARNLSRGRSGEF